MQIHLVFLLTDVISFVSCVVMNKQDLVWQYILVFKSVFVISCITAYTVGVQYFVMSILLNFLS